jgi:rod shape-determining protein MreB and related proteins
MKLNFNFLDLTARDIGIDLGTANILITLKGKGIVLNEPSVVAIDKKTNTVLATGQDAKEMLGRTPDNIKAVKPMKDGVIADFTATQILLKTLVQKICRRYNISRLRAVVGVPSGITEVEKRAVEESILQAGAKEVYLIEEPVAAAIGAGLEIAEPNGNIVVDIGGGTTEVAVISLGGVVVCDSLRIAGDELDEAIINYVKKELNLAIGQTTAEEIKINLGCAKPLMSIETMQIRGRDLNTGLPKVLEISSEQVMIAMAETISQIVEVVKVALEKTPPELSSDVMERGIILTGGGALIRNLDKLINEKTGIPVYISDTPLNAVVRGTGKALEDIEKLKSVLASSRKIK